MSAELFWHNNPNLTQPQMAYILNINKFATLF